MAIRADAAFCISKGGYEQEPRFQLLVLQVLQKDLKKMIIGGNRLYPSPPINQHYGQYLSAASLAC